MEIRNREPDLLVVGGGPAGMSAAIHAAERGVSVSLIDEAHELGGQIHRVPAPGVVPQAATHPAGESLRRRVAATAGIEVARGTAVLGVFEGLEVAIEEQGEVASLRPRSLLLATGAHEFTPPFPGWTLPGVMTPGAAQILAKSQGVAPGRRALVAGSGPFLLVVALALHRIGVEVPAVLEASPRRAWWGLPLRGWRTPGLLAEGLGHLWELRRAGIPVRYGRMVSEARGAERLEGLSHARVDGDWRVRGGVEREEVDTLCVGYGFVPRSQLAQSLGCEMELRPEWGGWVPRRDAEGRTSVAGVLVAGDCAGVAGSEVAALEGALAGLAVAADLGCAEPAASSSSARALRLRLSRLAPLRAALDEISRPRPGLEGLPREDTIVCRCEEISRAELREAVEHGAAHYRSLKVSTRIGMGPCQGLFCWPAASRAAASQLGCALERLGPASPRPPVRPVRLGALADAALRP